MKSFTTLFLVLALLISCNEKVVEEPENLISKEKMTNILYDLSILNAAKSSVGSKLDDSGIDVMEFLYEKYDIDSAQFSESDLYYASMPLEYQSIYQTLEEKIKREKDTLEVIAEQRNDSVRKANLKRSDSIKAAQEQGETKVKRPTPVEP